MKRFLSLLAAGVLALVLSSGAQAQTRGVQASSLILDDQQIPQHTVVVQAPQLGSQAYTDWGNAGFPIFAWSVPVPPVTGAQSGFVYPGPQNVGSGPLLFPYWVYPGETSLTNGSPVDGGSMGTWNFATAAQLGIGGGNGVQYDVTAPQNTSNVAGDYLFNVAYAAATTDEAATGAKIDATAWPGGNALNGATALTLNAKGNGTSTATGLSITTSTVGATGTSYNIVLDGDNPSEIVRQAASSQNGKNLTIKGGDAGIFGSNDHAAGILNLESGQSVGTGGLGEIDFYTSTNAGATANTPLNPLQLAMTLIGNDLTVVGKINSITFPAQSGSFMLYGPSAVQATQVADGAAYLFDVAYAGAGNIGDALGGKISADASVGNIALNAAATALVLNAKPNGSGQATGLAVTLTPGAGVNAAATFIGGDVGVGTTTPNVSVDINGDLSTHLFNFPTVGLGGTVVADANFIGQSWVELTAGTASSFIIDGFAGQGGTNAVSGKLLNIFNNSGFAVTFLGFPGNGTNGSGHAVYTRTGSDVVLPDGGIVHFQYDPNLDGGNGEWVMLDDIKSESTVIPTVNSSANVNTVTMGANSNDVAGKVTFTTTAAVTGDFAEVDFSSTYNNPVVVITPANAATASLPFPFYLVPTGGAGTSKFRITIGGGGVPNGTYSYFYHVIDTK